MPRNSEYDNFAEQAERITDSEPLPEYRWNKYIGIGLGILIVASLGAVVFVKFTWNWK